MPGLLIKQIITLDLSRRTDIRHRSIIKAPELCEYAFQGEEEEGSQHSAYR